MPSASSADPADGESESGSDHGPVGGGDRHRPPAVVFEGVTVRYGAVEALSDVDLTITAGERVALVGQSGAGKSTLLSIIAGLAEPTAGTVRVLGTDLASLRARHRRAHRAQVGIVSQHLHLPGALRVIHNINAGRLGHRSALKSMASLVHPDGRDEAKELLAAVGLGDVLMARTGTLSGGERQRVAVARVLRQQPRLVLADEPVSAIDPRLSDDVLTLLCAPDAPWTTVVSLHEPELARRYATRVLGLRDGRIAFDRLPGEVTDDALTELYRHRDT